MSRLRRFTDEQLERASQVDILDYARSQGYQLKKVGTTYKVLGYPGGLYLNPEKNVWKQFSNDIGGGVIKLCMELENKTFVEAVKGLLNEDMNEIRHTREWQPVAEEPKEFILPEKNDTYRHVFAYLEKTRGIDRAVIKELVDKGYIYENTHRSCVFVGRDKDGVAKHASVRSTNTTGKSFKQDVAGSQKQFSFSISGTSGVLNVCEAPIDVLSYMTLQSSHGIDRTDSYIALGGVSDKALEHFLSEHPDIEKIRVCTDNDIAGEGAAARIYEKYHEQYKVTRHRPLHKDFNEDLLTLKYPDFEEKQIFKQMELSEGATSWYNNAADKSPFRSDSFYVKGSCEVLIVCDCPKEVMAHADITIRTMKSAFGADYVPDEHYVAYKDEAQLQKYLKDNPGIKWIRICTGNTEPGQETARAITEKFGSSYRCDIESPKLTTWQQDLTELNTLEKAVADAIDQSPIVAQSEMAAAMEM